MKITVINGTPVKGVTYFMKEQFLDYMGNEHQITEFYPTDLPEFCVGCKNCFVNGEEKCPHFKKTDRIWNSFLSADICLSGLCPAGAGGGEIPAGSFVCALDGAPSGCKVV